VNARLGVDPEHLSSNHVRIEETATRTAEVAWNGNIAHTDTTIIASTLVVAGVVPSVTQGQFQDAARDATAATGRKETREGEERAHR
jgi:hypothetical protein